jgi:hypothetical protein
MFQSLGFVGVKETMQQMISNFDDEEHSSQQCTIQSPYQFRWRKELELMELIENKINAKRNAK